MSRSRARLLLAFGIVYLVWGSTYLAIRVGVETIPPFILSGTRNLVAGLLLLTLVRLRGRKATTSAHPPFRPSVHWRTAVIMGFLMFALGNAILSWAETRIDSGLAALLVGAIPLWVVLIARFNPWGPTRAITPQKVIGVAVGIAGLGLLVWPGAGQDGGLRLDPLAIGLLFIGSIGWAVGTVIAPSLPHPADKFEGSGMTMVMGGAMILLVATVRGEWSALDLGAIPLIGAVCWLYLVVFGSMIAYSAYVYLMANAEATTVATYALVNPVVAVFLGWLLLHEVVTSRMLLATGVIIAGLAFTLFGGEVAAWMARKINGRTAQGAM